MAGAFIPNAAQRRQPLLDGIAASDADIICLQEVWEETDKEAVKAATAASHPHALWFAHDLDSLIDDPTDQNGDIPSPHTEPPCAAAELSSLLDEVMACMMDNCSTIPGSDQGQAISIDCAQEHCLAPAVPLLTGDAAHQRCYTCAAVNLPAETFADIHTQCTTEVNGGLAFRGQSSLVLLSKFPLSAEEELVVPGTFNRRMIATATATLPNGASLDLFCNHLTPIFDDFAYPYTGQYGDGKVGKDGWAAEQYLQGQKLIAYVEKHSGTRPALVLGDMNAGRAYDSTRVIYAEGAATLDLLETVFLPALTPDYTPLCTYCDTNANNDTSLPSWIDHILMYNLQASAVRSTERVYDEDIVPVDDGEGGTVKVPLSDHYGLRAVIAVPDP
jgi:endonuclease/exonuclease/phosphatase family metal-dependent hydrolase